jgi:CBS domain-containing protein
MCERDLRHRVVVDAEGDLLGVVSHRDLLRHALIEQSEMPPFVERELLARTGVREVLVSPVLTADPEEDAAEAAWTLFENKVGCLPVVEGNRVLGILTESDFVRWFGFGRKSAPAGAPQPETVGATLARDEAWLALADTSK